MSVIPLVVGQTIATTEAQFDKAGGRQGKTLLIRNFDNAQLSADAPNLSYELRVGPEYKDHRDGSKWPVTDTEPITLLPGAAVIIETAESLHMPKGMFGYIVPRHGYKRAYRIRFPK
jgi:deoxycytidine triphosphate deaminase